MFSQQVDPVVALSDIHGPAKKAVDAGCKDPMILYLYARTSIGPFFPKLPEYNRRLQAAADAMAASAYSPYRRAVAVRYMTEQKAAKKDLTPDERREVERGLDAVLDLLARSVAEDPEERGVGSSLVRYPQRRHRRPSSARFRLQGGLRPGRRPARQDRWDQGPAAYREGNFLLHWGWEARSQRFASQVSEEQFRTFATRVGQARTALNEAWKAKPDEPNVADLMLEVEKAIGGGDREAMETWFERDEGEPGRPRSVLVEARLARPQVARRRYVGRDQGLRQGLRRDQELADRDQPARRRRPPASFQQPQSEKGGRCT